MQRVIIATTSEGSLDREPVVRVIPFTPCEIELPVRGEFRPFVTRIAYDHQRNERRPK